MTFTDSIAIKDVDFIQLCKVSSLLSCIWQMLLSKSVAIFETSYFSHASTALISLNGETSNSWKLFTKLTMKFHIWNQQWNIIITVSLILFLNAQIIFLVRPTRAHVQCFYSNWSFNGICSGAITLLIADWLPFLEGGI